jgi:hypothetical protein
MPLLNVQRSVLQHSALSIQRIQLQLHPCGTGTSPHKCDTAYHSVCAPAHCAHPPKMTYITCGHEWSPSKSKWNPLLLCLSLSLMPLKLASVVMTLVSGCTLLAQKRNSSNGNLCLAVIIRMVILPAGCAESAWHTSTARLVLVGEVQKLHLLLSCLLILSFSDDTISVHSAELFNINQNVAAVQKGKGITTTRVLSHNRRLITCTPGHIPV